MKIDTTAYISFPKGEAGKILERVNQEINVRGLEVVYSKKNEIFGINTPEKLYFILLGAALAVARYEDLLAHRLLGDMVAECIYCGTQLFRRAPRENELRRRHCDKCGITFCFKLRICEEVSDS